KYPQYEKIYATLGYSKLIIDEVQAYDPKACAIVVKMIEDIVSLGGRFLLMTATLPTFVKNYLKEKEIIKDEDIINFYECKLEIEIKTTSKHKIELRQKDIIEDIVEIIKKAKDGNRILVVLNTIEKAEEVYDKIEKKIANDKSDIFLRLIHSRFTLNQRREKEKEIEEKFKNPKPKEEKEAKIFVATQVVEASLDIDADYLFTEIAPMDSLIQRMGRVMRRVKYYEEYEQKEKNVFVYVCLKEDKNRFYIESGKGNVYENDILFLTFCVILNLILKENEKLKEVLRLFENSDEIEQQKEKQKTIKNLKELIKDLMKNISEIKIEIPLMEKDKNKIVEEVYNYKKFKYLTKSNYFKKFNQTLSILDSGYVSENKEEAHKLFREIYTISLVGEEKVKEIKDKIQKEINKKKDITWLWFKKEIIAEYVINDNMWKYREYELKPLGEKLCEMLDISEEIKRYCEGIWVVKKKSLKETPEESDIETIADSKGVIL
ncbi:MAG: CRISPR-associated helicase Cas3', partial [Candidatus Omnitrophica bacterium]|nr:CRISPR-associated helicase Cas3' [Candidatus Omnitrophota bacterium]